MESSLIHNLRSLLKKHTQIFSHKSSQIIISCIKANKNDLFESFAYLNKLPFLLTEYKSKIKYKIMINK